MPLCWFSHSCILYCTFCRYVTCSTDACTCMLVTVLTHVRTCMLVTVLTHVPVFDYGTYNDMCTCISVCYLWYWFKIAWREARQFWYLSPLTSGISGLSFDSIFSIRSLVILPCVVAPICSFFSCFWPVLLPFFQKFSIFKRLGNMRISRWYVQPYGTGVS